MGSLTFSASQYREDEEDRPIVACCLQGCKMRLKIATMWNMRNFERGMKIGGQNQDMLYFKDRIGDKMCTFGIVI